MKNQNKGFKKVIKKVLVPLRFLNNLIKKKEQILFYSNLGFRDNVKALFEYMIERGINRKYRIFISSDDYKNLELKNTANVQLISNKKGLLKFFTSKYVFYCFGAIPIKPSKKQIVINMWHGMPLKRIGLLDYNNKGNNYFYFTKLLATSPFFAEYMARAFGCTKEDVLIVGQPRNDELFTKKPVKEMFGISAYHKVIVWMPTFRNSKRLNENNSTSKDALPFVYSDDDLEKINLELSKINVLLLIKMHPMQDSLPFNKKDRSNVVFIDDKKIVSKSFSLYEFLSSCDALITDYSSVYFDFLLLDRPMCFTVDDLEDYKLSRGFIFGNPLDYMPGFKASCLADLVSFAKSLCIGKDDYSEERKKATEIFHLYVDGENSKRILDFCGIKED